MKYIIANGQRFGEEYRGANRVYRGNSNHPTSHEGVMRIHLNALLQLRCSTLTEIVLICPVMSNPSSSYYNGVKEIGQRLSSEKGIRFSMFFTNNIASKSDSQWLSYLKAATAIQLPNENHDGDMFLCTEDDRIPYTDDFDIQLAELYRSTFPDGVGVLNGLVVSDEKKIGVQSKRHGHALLTQRTYMQMVNRVMEGENGSLGLLIDRSGIRSEDCVPRGFPFYYWHNRTSSVREYSGPGLYYSTTDVFHSKCRQGCLMAPVQMARRCLVVLADEFKPPARFHEHSKDSKPLISYLHFPEPTAKDVQVALDDLLNESITPVILFGDDYHNKPELQHFMWSYQSAVADYSTGERTRTIARALSLNTKVCCESYEESPDDYQSYFKVALAGIGYFDTIVEYRPRRAYIKRLLRNSPIEYYQGGDLRIDASSRSDDSIDVLHVDMPNTGDTYYTVFREWLLKVRKLIILEGGSRERDQGLSDPIQPAIKSLESHPRVSRVVTVGTTPSVTFLYLKNEDDGV